MGCEGRWGGVGERGAEGGGRGLPGATLTPASSRTIWGKLGK